VSLAMIFDDRGTILWHRGRAIKVTESLEKGCGYCTSQACQVLRDKSRRVRTRCIATYTDLYHVESANVLNIKSVLILPVNATYFLYIDSGTRAEFAADEIAVFDSLGSLLGDSLLTLDREIKQPGKLTGSSPLIASIRDTIIRFAIEEEPVLLLGETGVGKSHSAEMIHACSGRNGPFVVVNTPGIPDTLLESQLFGHRKGAFSGAVADAEGFVSAAEGGTLFLDEIAEIEPALQAKLLRFIDTRKYRPLGDTAERLADVRIITATNQDLKAMIARKAFREDLYFRLNCLAISIPPLRERPADLADLIAECAPLLRGKKLTERARTLLLNYAWPGNVRELMQVLKRAGIQYGGAEIGGEIGELLAFADGEQNQPDATKVDEICRALREGVSFWHAVKGPYLKRDLNRGEVRAIVARGLRESGGTYTKLALHFNLKKAEYHNFMRFLHENALK
jgi:transcriptional regulator with PAS, ATPase and Fis domain